MRRLLRALGAAVWLIAAPAIAYAQSSITGVVRDTSGAVLPGVTVEAASEALIEKARVAVTDGNGQYRIVDLRPGVYAVTFTLPGFSTYRRDQLNLPAEFVARSTPRCGSARSRKRSRSPARARSSTSRARSGSRTWTAR